MKIFLSYRRADDAKSNIAGDLHERLEKTFGSGSVFFDKEGIGGGDDWKLRLERALSHCVVMLVIIGPDWAKLKNPNGESRLFDPNDITRWEVETGLQRSRDEGITVIPVLVTGAEIPRMDELPESLKQLLAKQVINLRNHPDFSKDFDELIRDIRRSRGFAEGDITFEKFEPETIYITEGPFLMGSQPVDGIPDYETPQHEIFLPAYRIGKYPVTNKQYEVFIRQSGISVPLQMGWDGQKIPQGKENHPVTGITWYEAIAYCEWLNKKTQRSYSLPNEAQWEKACRGGNNTFYPWGDDFDPARCNLAQPSTAAVNKYPEQNDYGCYDFVGNVRQWTGTLWGRERSAPDPIYAYPWQDDDRNDLDESSQIWRVVRGSSFMDESDISRCSARSGQLPENRGFPGSRYSFRVMMKDT